MAGFGAKYPKFAPFAGEEPTNALPKYGKMVTIGRLISANYTPNMSSGELYADDELAEKVEEFVSATIAMETDDMTDEVAAVVYGATKEVGQDGDLIWRSIDEQPLGGLTFLRTLMRNGNRLYRAYYYPKVKAALGNDAAQTKAGSVTFGTTNTTFTIMSPNFGGYRFTHEFEKEEDAVAWAEEKLGVPTP